MREPTYAQALWHSWRLVWHNKLLWILGLLSVFAGQFGLGDFLGQMMVWWNRAVTGTERGWWLAGGPLDAYGVVGLIWAGVIVLMVAAAVVFISVTAQGALIVVAADWYSKKSADSLAKAWHKAVTHFWTLLSINLIQKLLLGLLIFALAFGWRAAALVGGFWGNVTVAILSVVAVFLALIITATAVYAAGYAVVEDKHLVLALAKGWKLLREHVLVSAEISFILMLCGWVLAAVLFVGGFAAIIPAILVWVLGGLTGQLVFIQIGIVTGVLIYLLFVMWAGAIFNAFTTAAWTYLFMKMRHEGLVSRTVHWAERIIKW